MRNLIAHAISACLRTLCSLLFPATGKRRKPQCPAPVVSPQPYVSPWARPWTSPSKAEAAAFFQQQAERALQRERRQAAAYATLGVDYPYTYDGAPFGADDFARPLEGVCCHCGRWTSVPVACRQLGGTVLHACPDCVLVVGVGPMADETIHNSPSPQRRSA